MICNNASTLFLQITNTLRDVDEIILAGASSANQSFLARYLTVYIAGIYEQAIEEIVWEFASVNGNREIENFIANQLDFNFRNPDMSNIIRIVKQFNTNWAEKLKSMNQKNRLAIDSIIANKNSIAHGSSTTITIQDIKNYHKAATVIIETIDRLFLGT